MQDWVKVLMTVFGGPVVVFYMINWLLFKKKKSNIQGKVVLITGANSGLGKECANVFYRHGCNVILAGRNQEALNAVKQELEDLNLMDGQRVSVISIDLSKLDGIEKAGKAAVALYGHVDILVNNAGISYRGCVENTDLDTHMKLMTVNYFGQIALTKAILPEMLQSGGGHIVFVSSVQGRVAIPYRSAYSASKHALQAYCDSLRAEVSSQNISVCIVNPGYIHTNLSKNALCGDGATYGVMDANTASGLPPEKVAEVILDAVVNNRAEVTPAPLLHKAVIILRSIWPNLYFKIMGKRAFKQRKDYVKQQ